jgi:hypothetical protein
MNCPIPHAAAHGGLPRKAAFSGLGPPEDEVRRRLDLPPGNDPTASITPALGRLLRPGHGCRFPKPRTGRTGTKPDQNIAQRIGSVDVRERTRCPQRRAFGDPVEELPLPLAGNPAYVARADRKPFQRSQPGVPLATEPEAAAKPAISAPTTYINSCNYYSPQTLEPNLSKCTFGSAATRTLRLQLAKTHNYLYVSENRLLNGF